jgi:hypothetical protein
MQAYARTLSETTAQALIGLVPTSHSNFFTGSTAPRILVAQASDFRLCSKWLSATVVAFPLMPPSAQARNLALRCRIQVERQVVDS